LEEFQFSNDLYPVTRLRPTKRFRLDPWAFLARGEGTFLKLFFSFPREDGKYLICQENPA
jgi:hypothetical protein